MKLLLSQGMVPEVWLGLLHLLVGNQGEQSKQSVLGIKNKALGQFPATFTPTHYTEICPVLLTCVP